MKSQTIQNNLLVIKERIALAAQKAGRRAEDIQIVAVTKMVPERLIRQAYNDGLRIFGENRVQEAIPKIMALKDCPEISWHMIGHLQSNKVRKAVENFAMIQSVDSIDIGSKIAGIGHELKRQVEILLEVNVSGETTKFGLSPEEMYSVAEQIREMPELILRGLMTVGPLTIDRGLIRRTFAELKVSFDKIAESQINSGQFNLLSMGMTDDYEIAIEEGSNMIRLGRAIFGERKTI
ncbi:MAG TPA: YggS family pyridoxal phosphate-dependent enzyme [Candidatus Marinimicrobia bacterium]|nr:YggS family pyridoxal phosphate-dependent enzyme [Candidatus Neomarinimicrobiota bacterium]HRS50859.1 YggS family pyridoxal phosphate-dependent enzyme [Candidatus Neomarinimicrobiota bacterium]HRU91799.1 YggS family pyridoxal phosphate-dependent enzyme [Candidatus Neomarinimicrobiota bacterium]